MDDFDALLSTLHAASPEEPARARRRAAAEARILHATAQDAASAPDRGDGLLLQAAAARADLASQGVLLPGAWPDAEAVRVAEAVHDLRVAVAQTGAPYTVPRPVADESGLAYARRLDTVGAHARLRATGLADPGLTPHAIQRLHAVVRAWQTSVHAFEDVVRHRELRAAVARGAALGGAEQQDLSELSAVIALTRDLPPRPAGETAEAYATRLEQQLRERHHDPSVAEMLAFDLDEVDLHYAHAQAAFEPPLAPRVRPARGGQRRP